MQFDTILVANRGEIAVRVINTARQLGYRTVAVYTQADADAPHVALADEAVIIGVGPVEDSYLDADKILSAALETSSGAIHPGYGFLSENADFAHKVEAAGLVFIGPDPEAIQAMGSKAEAKRLMQAAGVPCVPGYEGDRQSNTAFVEAARSIGFPIMVKASAGGGGRGMRLVMDEADLPAALDLARSEAAGAFGSDELILEKAIQNPRHVEMQIFADTHLAVIHLGERDCSIQRRHQKVVEEAPCPIMTADLRSRMGEAAVSAARAVNYRGAGTVEFLLDATGDFYFLEMNTRLQVEHPVTELVTGLDLVALQIAVAQGEPLPLTQDDVTLTGHAIEVRLCAEKPSQGFMPDTGLVKCWRPAAGSGVRVDAGIREGQQISPYYDSMLAKIIAYGPNRDVARLRLLKAVQDTVLLGPATNTAFLADILGQSDFADGVATTAFVETCFPEGFSESKVSVERLALAAALISQDDRERALKRAGYVAPDQIGWTNGRILPTRMTLTSQSVPTNLTIAAVGQGWRVQVEDQRYDIQLETSGFNFEAHINGRRQTGVACVEQTGVALAIGAQRISVEKLRPGDIGEDLGQAGRITAPMPGLVQALNVSVGDMVAKGQTLAVLEAMKMQHQINAPLTGRVTALHVSVGQQLAGSSVMIEIEEET